MLPTAHTQTQTQTDRQTERKTENAKAHKQFIIVFSIIRVIVACQHTATNER